MAKYHLSSDGNPRVCTAEKGNCPLGGDAPHFASKVAARAAYEASVDVKVLASASRKKNRYGQPEEVDPALKREAEPLETVKPEPEYESRIEHKNLGSLKGGQKFYDNDGELVEIVSTKTGSKNSTIVAKDAAGKERKIYRSKDELVQAIVKTQTEESKARSMDAYREENLERALKSYEPRQAKVLGDLMVKTQEGYRADSWDYKRLMDASATDEVYATYDRTVDMVKQSIAEKREGYENETQPYSRAFKLVEAEFTKEILRNATRGESNSTSDVSNVAERELMRAKAEFLDNIRWA